MTVTNLVDVFLGGRPPILSLPISWNYDFPPRSVLIASSLRSWNTPGDGKRRGVFFFWILVNFPVEDLDPYREMPLEPDASECREIGDFLPPSSIGTAQ